MGIYTYIYILKRDSEFLKQYPYFHSLVKSSFRHDTLFGINVYRYWDVEDWDMSFSDYSDIKYDPLHDEVIEQLPKIRESLFVDYEDDIDAPTFNSYIMFMLELMEKEYPQDYYKADTSD
jgi:hypothetical protein